MSRGAKRYHSGKGSRIKKEGDRPRSGVFGKILARRAREDNFLNYASALSGATGAGRRSVWAVNILLVTC